MANAQERADRRAIADILLPSFSVLRGEVTTLKTVADAKRVEKVTLTFNDVEYEFVRDVQRMVGIETELRNRVLKSVREWFQDI
jgi:hypothetical protein